MAKKRLQPKAPEQLALFTVDKGASPALPLTTLPPTREVHHHIEYWFHDFRPNIIICTADPTRPTFKDEVWSVQFRDAACYFEDCYICNPDFQLKSKDEL